MQDIGGGHEYGQYIRRITFHMMQIQDERLAPYDITSQQARVLCMIRLYLDQAGGCHQKHLEVGAGLRGSSVNSLINGLERRGYVRRASGLRDRRTKELTLTEKGAELVDTFLAIFRETERKAVDGFSDGERTLLLELLQRIATNLEHT